MAEVKDNFFTLILVLRCSPYGVFSCRVGFRRSVWELMKGDFRAVAPRGGDAAAVLQLKMERFHREDVLEHANKLDDGALALRPRQGSAPACPSEKGQRCKCSGGGGGEGGQHVLEVYACPPTALQPGGSKGQECSTVYWCDCMGGWGIIPSVWVSESSEARKHEPAHFRTLLSVVCNGKVW